MAVVVCSVVAHRWLQTRNLGLSFSKPPLPLKWTLQGPYLMVASLNNKQQIMNELHDLNKSNELDLSDFLHLFNMFHAM